MFRRRRKRQQSTEFYNGAFGLLEARCGGSVESFASEDEAVVSAVFGPSQEQLATAFVTSGLGLVDDFVRTPPAPEDAKRSAEQLMPDSLDDRAAVELAVFLTHGLGRLDALHRDGYRDLPGHSPDWYWWAIGIVEKHYPLAPEEAEAISAAEVAFKDAKDLYREVLAAGREPFDGSLTAFQISCTRHAIDMLIGQGASDDPTSGYFVGSREPFVVVESARYDRLWLNAERSRRLVIDYAIEQTE